MCGLRWYWPEVQAGRVATSVAAGRCLGRWWDTKCILLQSLTPRKSVSEWTSASLHDPLQGVGSLWQRGWTQLRVEGSDGSLCPQNLSSKNGWVHYLQICQVQGNREKLGLICSRETDLRGEGRQTSDHQERLLDSIAQLLASATEAGCKGLVLGSLRISEPASSCCLWPFLG